MAKRFLACGMAMLLASGSAVSGQTYLMVPDSSRNMVMLFDPFDGSLVNPSWINLGGLAPGSQTPIAAIEVDDEIWVSDQLADLIYRFTKDEFAPQHLGNITGAMDNIRGIARLGGTVYVSNAGTANGAPGSAVVTIDIATKAVTGFFPSGNPFDVLPFGSNLLVNDIGAARKIDEFTTGGSHVRVFATGPNFPEQMNYNAAGNILVASFSSPIGIWEFDTNGTQVNFYQVGTGNRGVYELGNGNILVTFGTNPGIYSYNIATNTATPIQTVAGSTPRYIHPVTFGKACYPDCDTGTGPGVLDIFDFLCFGNRFAANDPYACDCDLSTGPGVCDIFDFLCFGNAFHAGCP